MVQSQSGDIVNNYAYDQSGRMVTMAYEGNLKQQFTYDANNNVLGYQITRGSELVKEVGYRYDGLNRMIAVVDDGITHKYDYDAEGNQLGKTVSWGDGTSHWQSSAESFAYNGFGQLQRYENENQFMEYQYDYSGLRRSKETMTGEEQYYYYNGQIVLETDGQQVVKAANTWYGSSILSRTMDEETYYYRQNEHNDVIAFLDFSGNTLASYTFDAYGQAKGSDLQMIGSIPGMGQMLTDSQEYIAQNPFRYAGQYLDAESNLYYLRGRYYDASTERFITEDPAKDGLNWYAYCYNNPIKYIDPSGNMPVYASRGVSGLYNSRTFDASSTSTFALVANGFGIYTAFHEIAQLNIAKRLNELGYSSTLEYSITSKTEKAWWGGNKKYEADIVSGNMVWEVKPLGTDGTAQLQKYMTDGNLTAGFTIDPYGQAKGSDLQMIGSIPGMGQMLTASREYMSNNPCRYAGRYLDAKSNLYYLRGRYYGPASEQF